MFDEAEYWRRRNKGLRGQGIKISPIFIPKGESVTWLKPDGRIVEVLNSEGSHAKVVNKRMVMLNRPESRRRQVSRFFTKTGFKSHEVVEPKFKPSHPPSLTNNQRMKLREIKRSKV